MTATTPSQVVVAIDAMFGPDRNELALAPGDLLELNRCRASLELAASFWERGQEAQAARQVGGRDPVERIRRLLASCPDEVPPEVDLPFVDALDVRIGIEDLIRTAWTNYRVGEWSGATVFAGTAIEALLLWLVRTRGGDVPVAAAPEQDPLNRASFEELIKRAEAAQLLDAATLDQIRGGQAARNLIHPGRSIRLGRLCSRGTSLVALSAFYILVEDLAKRAR
jgi:hypothetical protein